MTNISNSEKITDIKNNDLSSSLNKNDSFYSLELPENHKILNRKHSRLYSGRNIYRKINKIQKSQNNANIKLDILLSIIKSKLLGEYDYNISHYELSFHSTTNDSDSQKENKEKEKEDNNFNIKDDFEQIDSIKKEPISPLNKEYKKKSDNIKNNNSLDNLKDITNDFIFENKNGKNNANFNNNENGENNMSNNENENPDFYRDINKNVNPDDYNNKSQIKKEDKTHLKNVRTFGDINNININSLLNNENKIFKNEINLNKYKIEANDIKYNNNGNENEIKDNNIIKESNKNANKEETEENIIFDKEETENININEEINKKGDNGGGTNVEEEKEIEARLDISQSDRMSVNSLATNSSGKKSNHSSSRKIRGFNFRNKIEIKKYSANKFSPSSSNNNNQKK